MKTLSILQPGYLPWLGFFEQMDRTDIFVIYDDVQYDKHSWRNRNRIKTAQGIQWLTVPVLTSKRSGQLVNEVEIDNRVPWQKKHLRALEQNYRKARWFDRYYPLVEEGYVHSWNTLLECDMFFINLLKHAFGITTSILFSSGLTAQGKSTDRLVRLCEELGATVFYEGMAGKNYIDDTLFLDNGIQIVYQDYNHPVYSQLHGAFISHLSAVDLLFNEGPEGLKLLRTCSQNSSPTK